MWSRSLSSEDRGCERTYDVFGAPRSQANEFQFAGEQVDASTGLQYLRARYYDFEAGRFISREPLAALPGWGGNPFGYAAGNPVSLVDPTGEVPVDANGCTPKELTCQVDNSCHWQRGTDPYGRGAWCDWEQNNCYISPIEGVVCLGPSGAGARSIGKAFSTLLRFVGENLKPLGAQERDYAQGQLAIAQKIAGSPASAHACAADPACALVWRWPS